MYLYLILSTLLFYLYLSRSITSQIHYIYHSLSLPLPFSMCIHSYETSINSNAQRQHPDVTIHQWNYISPCLTSGPWHGNFTWATTSVKLAENSRVVFIFISQSTFFCSSNFSIMGTHSQSWFCGRFALFVMVLTPTKCWFSCSECCIVLFSYC